jgi:hypothetical protein
MRINQLQEDLPMFDLGSVITVQGEVLAIDPADGAAPRLVLLKVRDGDESRDVEASLDAAIDRLRAEPLQRQALAILFGWLSGFSRNRGETSVERASASTGLTIRIVKSLFHQLETVGLGRYVRGGRGGHKSRFRWNFPVRDVSAAFFAD